MSFVLYGSSAARGIAIGHVVLFGSKRPDVVELRVDPNALEEEKKRLVSAIARTNSYLTGVKNTIPGSAPKELVSFVDTHIQIVGDETLLEGVCSLINQHHCNSEWALNLYQESLLSVFEEMQDAYFEARKADIRHVLDLILTNLSVGRDQSGSRHRPIKGGVVVAADLSPADLIILCRGGVSGLFTELGASASHTSILARSLGIPAVTGISHALKLFREKDSVIVDGEGGLVVGDPDDCILNEYQKKALKIDRQSNRSTKYEEIKDVVSADGEDIKIFFNLDMIDDTENLFRYGANSIGLFRTDFLFLNRADYPTEEEHLAVYKKIISESRQREFTIRTADIGPDKLPEQLSVPTSSGSISALGICGLRFSLKQPKIFLPQLRAIIRASALGKVRLMLPMVTDLDEIEIVRVHIAEIRREFRLQGIEFDRNMPIGAMIEVPAAAAAAPLFADSLDFLSIGSNDLVQYANAADRQNSDVAYLYQPLHFGVIKLISWVVSSTLKAKKRISICGEMASDCRLTALLLGLGLKELSIRPAVFLELQEKIRTISVYESKQRVKEYLDSGNLEILEALVIE